MTKIKITDENRDQFLLSICEELNAVLEKHIENIEADDQEKMCILVALLINHCGNLVFANSIPELKYIKNNVALFKLELQEWFDQRIEMFKEDEKRIRKNGTH